MNEEATTEVVEAAPRQWPISVRVQRCPAWDYAKARACGRLLWPWQDVRREFDPECGGRLRHHECHHRETRGLWESEDGAGWTGWLNCEHRTPERDIR